MMKYYLLIVLLYSVLSQENGNCLTGQNFSDKECFQEQKKYRGFYCCVVVVTKTDNSVRECIKLDPQTYDEYLDVYKNSKKEDDSVLDVSVDCRPGYKSESESRSGSNYLKLSILSILILIINL